MMERVHRRERERRVGEAFELVGLEGFERRRVPELSGGQHQRAALARALVKRPAVLLLDEPLVALDLQLRKQMQDELARLKASMSTTFVHVTHDQGGGLCDRGSDRGHAGRARGAGRRALRALSPPADEVRRELPRRRDDHPGTYRPSRRHRRDRAFQADRARWGCDVAPGRALAAVIPADKIRLSWSASGSIERAHTSGAITRVVFTGTTFLVHVRVAEDIEIKASMTAQDAAPLGDALPGGSLVAAGRRHHRR
jgi:ABC transporter